MLKIGKINLSRLPGDSRRLNLCAVVGYGTCSTRTPGVSPSMVVSAHGHPLYPPWLSSLPSASTAGRICHRAAHLGLDLASASTMARLGIASTTGHLRPCRGLVGLSLVSAAPILISLRRKVRRDGSRNSRREAMMDRSAGEKRWIRETGGAG